MAKNSSITKPKIPWQYLIVKDDLPNLKQDIASYRSSRPEVLCRPTTLFKKRLWHRCFPVNFAKFPRIPFFIEHIWWLLLKIKRSLRGNTLTPSEKKIALKMYRSNPPEMFLWKGVLKLCSKFTRKHPYQSVISIKLLKQLYWNLSLTWLFSCKFATYFQNSFFYRKPPGDCL